MSLGTKALILVTVAIRGTFQSKPYSSARHIYTYSTCTPFYNKFPQCFSRSQENVCSLREYCNMPEKKAFQRLPKDIVPSNYALRLQPDLAAFTFQGQEEISVEVKTTTKYVVLNSVDIDVKSVKYSGQDQAFEDEIKTCFSKEDETVTFEFPAELKVGPGTLTLSYTGELNDKMKGFYRSKYSSPSGEDRYGAVTQFEATDARRAFPGWDEPAVKATFDITLVVPKDRVALSNMPVKTDTPMEGNEDLKVVTYERSPIMSTYLLAFVVGEYDFVEATDTDGIKVRVYTPVGKKEQGQFALDVAVKTLPFYHNYFNVAYPLPKIDLIAIADFAAGAMENWGLVTYRETALLVDAKNSSSHARQWVALVVGHELAHQWFGNLVTMEWWTHLWLNEGFASWIEYLCVDYVAPEFDIWTQFASSDFTRALELDALRNSHPIEVPVGHPDEVDEIFDAISYSKGASVIRMLHDYIGDEDYRKGMHNYLTKHKYQNTFTEDLWEALGDASGKPVNTIMSTWTKQMGYPVLKVSQTVDGTNRILTIEQKKFCADGVLDGISPQWLVPISVSTASSPETAIHRFVMDSRKSTFTVPDVAPADWIKLNTGAVGFYRTEYTLEMLEALMAGIQQQTLPPRDRLSLQNDLFALARAGVISTVEVLKVAQAFSSESNYTVWNDVSSNLAIPSLLAQYTDYQPSMKAYMRRLFKPVSQKLGWDAKEGESHLDAMLRGLVISRMGSAEDEDIIAEAQMRFNAHHNGSNTLVADLRSPVYSTVLRANPHANYDKLLKLYRSADLQEEKVRISGSMGAVKDPKLIKRTLEFAMSDEVRSQDTVFVIAGVTRSREGREAAWEFIKERWSELHNRYEGGFLLARLIKTATENFVTEEKLKDIAEFFEAHPAPAAERTIQQSLENIRLNMGQLERDSSAIEAFLKEQSSSS